MANLTMTPGIVINGQTWTGLEENYPGPTKITVDYEDKNGSHQKELFIHGNPLLIDHPTFLSRFCMACGKDNMQNEEPRPSWPDRLGALREFCSLDCCDAAGSLPDKIDVVVEEFLSREHLSNATLGDRELVPIIPKYEPPEE